VAAHYRGWTAPNSDPREALAGLLALVHCLRSGEIRALRLADVISSDRLSVGDRIVHLAEPVAEALARYLGWRAERYGGPSTYLMVSRASRLHDRSVSPYCLQRNILGGVTVSSLRQTAIQNLIQGAGCDGLQLASYASLSLDAVGVYMRAFNAPTPWPAGDPRRLRGLTLALVADSVYLTQPGEPSSESDHELTGRGLKPVADARVGGEFWKLGHQKIAHPLGERFPCLQ